jgi:hypothetical protein
MLQSVGSATKFMRWRYGTNIHSSSGPIKLLGHAVELMRQWQNLELEHLRVKILLMKLLRVFSCRGQAISPGSEGQNAFVANFVLAAMTQMCLNAFGRQF